ncbi:hypothetical protein [Sporosarcina psychrophila]|uniref:Uncharacterized protein n=1 Tax=Sporosarcina psychrophila TaxID=1476 RepID=A0ABV2KES0_SPOPS
MKDRTNKTISFAHYDAYELDLMTYALDPARGKFGPYIKRLIERDRDGGQAQVVADIPKPAAGGGTKADKASVAGFL